MVKLVELLAIDSHLRQMCETLDADCLQVCNDDTVFEILSQIRAAVYRGYEMLVAQDVTLTPAERIDNTQ